MGKSKEENWVEQRGWKKINGFIIKMDELRDACDDDWDSFYVTKTDLSDYVKKQSFWTHEDDESVFEDVSDLIEYLEEHTTDVFADVVKEK